VEHQERPQKHHRIAHAEDVCARPASGDGEDVAEERDVSVTNEIRVGELARPRVESGGPKRARRCGHHPTVCRNCDEVQKTAHGDDPNEAEVEVAKDAGAGQPIGRDVRDPMEGEMAGGRKRHEHHLDGEGEHDQPHPAQPELLESAQPSSRHRDRDEQQEEGEGEGHSGAGAG
jgi:hypothetical protein